MWHLVIRVTIITIIHNQARKEKKIAMFINKQRGDHSYIIFSYIDFNATWKERRVEKTEIYHLQAPIRFERKTGKICRHFFSIDYAVMAQRVPKKGINDTKKGKNTEYQMHFCPCPFWKKKEKKFWSPTRLNHPCAHFLQGISSSFRKKSHCNFFFDVSVLFLFSLLLRSSFQDSLSFEKQWFYNK